MTRTNVRFGLASMMVRWDNDADEYSVSIGYPAQRPVSRLYSERQGACVAEYRRNAT